MIKNVHQYYVYILSNKPDGTLYIGMTKDIQRRILEHKQGSIDGFTKKYRLDVLVYLEMYHNVNDAISREKQLKKWKRLWKIELIEKGNPKWLDLSIEWND